MKNWITLVGVVLATMVGSLSAQAPVKPKHPTFYDKLREQIFEEKANSDQAFQSYREKSGQKVLSLYAAPEITREAYQAWLWERVMKMKFKTIKLGGKIDFGGEKGTTYSINPGFSFEVHEIPNVAMISVDFDAGLERNDTGTSFELTGGGKAESPLVLKYVSFYGKASIGFKVPGGGERTSLIWNYGPGVALKISNTGVALGIDILFYYSPKAVFSDGDIMKKHDMVLNIAITYSFSTGKII